MLGKLLFGLLLLSASAAGKDGASNARIPKSVQRATLNAPARARSEPVRLLPVAQRVYEMALEEWERIQEDSAALGLQLRAEDGGLRLRQVPADGSNGPPSGPKGPSAEPRASGEGRSADSSPEGLRSPRAAKMASARRHADGGSGGGDGDDPDSNDPDRRNGGRWRLTSHGTRVAEPRFNVREPRSPGVRQEVRQAPRIVTDAESAQQVLRDLWAHVVHSPPDVASVGRTATSAAEDSGSQALLQNAGNMGPIGAGPGTGVVGTGMQGKRGALYARILCELLGEGLARNLDEKDIAMSNAGTKTAMQWISSGKSWYDADFLSALKGNCVLAHRPEYQKHALGLQMAGDSWSRGVKFSGESASHVIQEVTAVALAHAAHAKLVFVDERTMDGVRERAMELQVPLKYLTPARILQALLSLAEREDESYVIFLRNRGSAVTRSAQAMDVLSKAMDNRKSRVFFLLATQSDPTLSLEQASRGGNSRGNGGDDGGGSNSVFANPNFGGGGGPSPEQIEDINSLARRFNIFLSRGPPGFQTGNGQQEQKGASGGAGHPDDNASGADLGQPVNPLMPPPALLQKLMRDAMSKLQEEMKDDAASGAEDDLGDEEASISDEHEENYSDLSEFSDFLEQVLGDKNFANMIGEHIKQLGPLLNPPQGSQGDAGETPKVRCHIRVHKVEGDGKPIGISFSNQGPKGGKAFQSSGPPPASLAQQSSTPHHASPTSNLPGWVKAFRRNTAPSDSFENSKGASPEHAGASVPPSGGSLDGRMVNSGGTRRGRVKAMKQGVDPVVVGQGGGSADPDSPDTSPSQEDQIAFFGKFQSLALTAPKDPTLKRVYTSILREEAEEFILRRNRQRLAGVFRRSALSCPALRSTIASDTTAGLAITKALSQRRLKDQELARIALLALQEELGQSTFRASAGQVASSAGSCGKPVVDEEGFTVIQAESLHAAIRQVLRLGYAVGMGHVRSREELASLANDKHERALIANVISPQDIGVTYDMIGGLQSVKDVLRQTITYPLKFPHLYTEGIAAEAVKGLLLFGPPGTGKTMLAKAVATEGGATFLSVDASVIENKWLGESEKNAKAVFTLARRLAPCVIFLDEVDSVLSSREHGDDSTHGTLTSVKTTLMQEWDGLQTTTDRVVVIASTNRPFDLDEAVLRRLPRRIMVDLPDADTRHEILKVTLAHNRLAPDVNLTRIANDLEGYTGSDIKEVCREAVLRISHEAAAQLESNPVVNFDPASSSGEPAEGQGARRSLLRPVNSQDFKIAMERLSASVSEKSREMQKVLEWNEQYGEIKSKRKESFVSLYM